MHGRTARLNTEEGAHVNTLHETNKDQAPARLFVVDDHPITRYGLIELINHEPDLRVCGEAEDARTARKGIVEQKPDLIVMDLTLPDRSGLELIKDLKALDPEFAVLVLSMHDEALYAERVLRAGGRGYVMKREGGARFLEAVRHVLSGKIYISERISTPLLEVLSGQVSQDNRPLLAQLTDREFEVFQFIGQGFTTAEIAGQLQIGGKTVDTHRQRIKEKLRMRSTPELVKYAVRWAATQEKA